MKRCKEFFSDLSETMTVTRLDGVLIVAIGTLVGVIIGMLCSPRKNLTCGCGNGTTTIHNWDDEDWFLDDDEWEEEE